jgi:hypothetical protein
MSIAGGALFYIKVSLVVLLSLKEQAAKTPLGLKIKL